jgi:predicted DNA repair protein MutK
MSVGLIALLDDLAALAKVAAAHLDNVASQAAKAGAKAAGVVIDDAAVTPGYVIGFAAKRELPIVGRIAAGSLRNKLLILLPVALTLSYFLPWTITPLLMIGGAYLCYEGVEKVLEVVMPHRAHQHEAQLGIVSLNAKTVEDEKVASAIKIDFILSAEIMAIALAALPAQVDCVVEIVGRIIRQPDLALIVLPYQRLGRHVDRQPWRLDHGGRSELRIAKHDARRGFWEIAPGAVRKEPAAILVGTAKQFHSLA